MSLVILDCKYWAIWNLVYRAKQSHINRASQSDESDGLTRTLITFIGFWEHIGKGDGEFLS